MVVTDLADTFFANNPRTFRFTITDEDTTGSPAKDLTGRKIKWAMSRISAAGTFSTTPVLEKKSTNAGEITIVDAVNGVLDVNLLPADTLTFSGDFYFELEVFDSGGLNGVVCATGTLTINRNLVNT